MTDPSNGPASVDESETLAEKMVSALVEAGHVHSPEWRRLLAEFPRHIFVPDTPPADAYTTAVVTQTRRSADGTDRDLATSSLSAPAAVAVALEAMTLAGDERVLEIGTGTGYVAGLLSRRLGSQRVFSVDIDPELVTAAAERLARLDVQPTLRTGDGYEALLEHAPYDRILATCSINHVPPEWVRQLAPGGRIVAPLAGDLDSPIVVLDKTADDEVTGRFHLGGGGFMPLRSRLESPFGPRELNVTGPCPISGHSTTALDPTRVTDRTPALTLFCHLHLPGLQLLTYTKPGELEGHLVARQHESSATVSPIPGEDGRWELVQSGPHRIWDTIEAAFALWEHLGHPDADRFGISALDAVHRQYVWLDNPNGPYAWPLDP